jgi:hypothetical protein
MRVQVGRQQKEILQLQRAGISTASAELLLGRMNAKIGPLRATRTAEEGRASRTPSAGRTQMVVQWYDDDADTTPWFKALEDVRRKATREGHCYQHVQAIIVAIDQYAEAATGNGHYFLSKPQKIG